VVVDDASTDGSREIIRQYPCRLVELERRSGAGRARTVGALNSSGKILFFTDVDCLVRPDTLQQAEAAVRRLGDSAVVGGTYTPVPYDTDFFSLFQSVFIHHSELRGGEDADYLAGHAMAIPARTFWKTGGFPENKRLPILEDVEYSHRLRRMGYRLRIDRRILVQHVFNFTLLRSLRNGWRKSFHWTRYSLRNRDLCADSGTASRSLKTTVGLHGVCLFLLLGHLIFTPPLWVSCLVPATGAYVVWTNRYLLRAFRRVSGPVRAGLLFFYYAGIYPFSVEAGSILGSWVHLWGRLRSRTLRPSLVPLPLSIRAGTSRMRKALPG